MATTFLNPNLILSSELRGQEGNRIAELLRSRIISGETIANAARALNITTGRAYHLMHRRGFRMRPLTKITDDQVKKAVQNVAAGGLLRVEAEKLGVTSTGLAARFDLLGAKRPGVYWGKLDQPKVDDAIAKIAAGAFISDVARELGVTPMTLVKHRLRRGYSPVGRFDRIVRVALPSEPTSIAYLAGIIDGEGCVRHNRIQDGFNWGIGVTNTNKPLMLWVANIFQCRVHSRQRPCPRSTHKMAKRSYEVCCNRGIDVLAICKAILPFSIVKRDKIQECIDNLSIRMPFGDHSAAPTSTGS